MAGLTPPHLSSHLSKRHVELVVNHDDLLGTQLIEGEQGRTLLPESFMYVCGLSNQTTRSPAPPRFQVQRWSFYTPNH